MQTLNLKQIALLYIILFNLGEMDEDKPEHEYLVENLIKENGGETDNFIFDNEGVPMGTGVKGLYDYSSKMQEEFEETRLLNEVSYGKNWDSYFETINTFLDDENPSKEKLLNLLKQYGQY